jgi:hypothetical protein
VVRRRADSRRHSVRTSFVGGVARVERYADSANRGSLGADDIHLLRGADRYTGEAGLVSVSTAAGAPTPSRDDLTLSVPAATSQLCVTATPVAHSVSDRTVNGVTAQSGLPSETIDPTEGMNRIFIVVTAANGTARKYILMVDRASLPLTRHCPQSVSIRRARPGFRSRHPHFARGDNLDDIDRDGNLASVVPDG